MVSSFDVMGQLLVSLVALKDELDLQQPERLRLRLRTPPYPSEVDQMAAWDQVFQSDLAARQVLVPILLEKTAYGVLRGAMKYALAQDDWTHLDQMSVRLHQLGSFSKDDLPTLALENFQEACRVRALTCGRHLSAQILPTLLEDVWSGFMEKGQVQAVQGYIVITQVWPAPAAVCQLAHADDQVPLLDSIRSIRRRTFDRSLVHLASMDHPAAFAWAHDVLALAPDEDFPETRAYVAARARAEQRAEQLKSLDRPLRTGPRRRG